MPAEPRVAIARGSVDDLALLEQLRARFWHEQVAMGLIDGPECIDTFVKQGTLGQLDRPRTVFLGAKVDGQLAGYVIGQVKRIPGTTPAVVASIEEIFVGTPYRRSQVASALVHSIVGELRGDTNCRMQLRVLSANPGGSAFWAAHGFEPNLTTYELRRT